MSLCFPAVCMLTFAFQANPGTRQMLVKPWGLSATHNVGATMPGSLDTSKIPLRTPTQRLKIRWNQSNLSYFNTDIKVIFALMLSLYGVLGVIWVLSYMHLKMIFLMQDIHPEMREITLLCLYVVQTHNIAPSDHPVYHCLCWEGWKMSSNSVTMDWQEI